MFKFFKRKPKIEPKVGMVLVDKTWGDYNKIQITRVSEDKKDIMYIFLRVKGSEGVSGVEYDSDWKYGILSIYEPLNK